MSLLLQENAWMTSDTFHSWMVDVFIPYTADQRKEGKVLLLLDNFSGHLDIRTLEAAHEAGVCMVTFRPKTTHIQQPLDDVPIQSFRSAISKAVDIRRVSAPLEQITPQTLILLMARPCKALMEEGVAMSPWARGFSRDNIKKAFFNTSIMPLDSQQVLQKHHHTVKQPTADEEHVDEPAFKEITNMLAPPPPRERTSVKGTAKLVTSADFREELLEQLAQKEQRKQQTEVRKERAAEAKAVRAADAATKAEEVRAAQLAANLLHVDRLVDYMKQATAAHMPLTADVKACRKAALERLRMKRPTRPQRPLPQRRNGKQIAAVAAQAAGKSASLADSDDGMDEDDNVEQSELMDEDD